MTVNQTAPVAETIGADLIERVSAPGREWFEENHLKRNKPVILTDVVTRWPAYTRWTPEYLRELASDSIVTVRYHEDGDFHRWYGGEKIDKHIPFGEYLDMKLGEPRNEKYNLTEIPLSEISPELVKDIDLSTYLDPSNPPCQNPLVFVGNDTYLPLHYHGHLEALASQVRGEKVFTLFPPGTFGELYPYDWRADNFSGSRVDLRKPDLERFPRFAQAKPLTFSLHAGETLFIPVHWWHATRCEGFQVSVTYFRPSTVRRYKFPFPGVQVLAHSAYVRARAMFHRLRK